MAANIPACFSCRWVEMARSHLSPFFFYNDLVCVREFQMTGGWASSAFAALANLRLRSPPFWYFIVEFSVGCFSCRAGGSEGVWELLHTELWHCFACVIMLLTLASSITRKTKFRNVPLIFYPKKKTFFFFLDWLMCRMGGEARPRFSQRTAADWYWFLYVCGLRIRSRSDQAKTAYGWSWKESVHSQIYLSPR